MTALPRRQPLSRGLHQKQMFWFDPVTLIPYRTFLEVKQPESEFVFCIKDAGGAPVFKIVEAEGGLWKNVAMKEIRDYFVRNLESEEDLYKRLTIIA